MPQLSQEQIDHLAKLARIDLGETEKVKFAQELPKIVEFVEQLREVKLAGNLPTATAVELASLRSDDIKADRPQLSLEQLAALAPNPLQKDQLVVPAVFEQEADA